MTGQTKLLSIVESLVNIAIGYAIALALQMIIFPLYGIHISLETNITIGMWFMLVSICRSYCLRRLFNGWAMKGLLMIKEDATEAN